MIFFFSIMRKFFVWLVICWAASVSFAQEVKQENLEQQEEIVQTQEEKEEEGQEEVKEKGPYFLGILPNTRLELDLVYTTEYISRGLLTARTSQQTNLTLTVDNPCVDACFDPELYFISFTNVPLENPTISNEIDYTFGATFHVKDICQKTPVVFDIGYTYYTYPLHNIEYNRSDEFYVGLLLDGSPLKLNMYLYYDVILEQTVLEGRFRYEEKLKNTISYVPESWEIKIDGFTGYLNALAYNSSDQRKNGVGKEKNGYVYAGAIVLLNYKLNKYAKLGTGFTWAINNDGYNNLGSHENLFAWNIVQLSLEY